MDFDYQYDMPSDDYQFDVDETTSGWGTSQPQGGFDMGQQQSMGGWGDNFDLGSLEGGSWQMPQQQQSQQMELPSYEQPSGWAPANQQPPARMSEPAPQLGGAGGSGGGREEESWMKTLGKAGLGMTVGAGTSILGTMASNAMAPKEKSAPQQQAMPMPANPQAQYQPQALEPLPGTQASPLLRGGPTSVQTSAGLKENEKKRSYGGFSMY